MSFPRMAINFLFRALVYLSFFSELVVLVMWGWQEYKTIFHEDMTSFSVEQGKIIFYIKHPLYVGPGESGILQMVVVNKTEKNISNLRISLTDEGDVWFLKGNEIQVANLQAGSQNVQNLDYSVFKYLNPTQREIPIQAYVEYQIEDSTLSTSTINNPPAILPSPVNRISFPDTVIMKVSNSKPWFLYTFGSNINSEETSDMSSSLSTLLAGLTAILTSLLAFQGKISELLTWLKDVPKFKFSSPLVQKNEDLSK